jgi:hypothetical protein
MKPVDPSAPDLRVLADRLTEADDPRGEWLLLHLDAAREPRLDDRIAMEELVEEAVAGFLRSRARCREDHWMVNALVGLERARRWDHRLPGLAARLGPSLVEDVARIADEPSPVRGLLERRRRVVLEVLEAAFDGLLQPGVGHRTLQEGEAEDDYGVDPERRDPTLRWQDVPDDYLLAYQNAWTYLDAEGFRFYLPAALAFDLRHLVRPHMGEHWMLESIGYQLLPDARRWGREFALRNVRLLTRDQRAVVVLHGVVTGAEEQVRRWDATLDVPEDRWMDVLLGDET